MVIYHNPRCRKSRETLALLEEHGQTPEVCLYLEDAPSAKEILELAGKLGMAPRDMMRTKEELWKELDLGSKDYSDKEWVQVIAEHPKLLERPIVVKGGRAVIGRPPENVLALLH